MLMFSCISSTTEEAATEGTCSSMERSSSKVKKSDWMLVTAPEPPPAYSSSTRLVPMPWISLRMYWRPVAEMATTRMTDAVPMTMPSAVSTKRTFDERKLSMASLAISLSMIVCRALAMVFSNEIRRVRSETMCSYRMPDSSAKVQTIWRWGRCALMYHSRAELRKGADQPPRPDL